MPTLKINFIFLKTFNFLYTYLIKKNYIKYINYKNSYFYNFPKMIVGLNIFNINFKNFFINNSKLQLNMSNKQIIKKNNNMDAILEFSKKNLKNIKYSFLYFLKLIKKFSSKKNIVFYLKNKNFIFFFNFMFFFKNLLKEFNLMYFLINLSFNKNYRWKKIKSIKKRLVKKMTSNIKIY